MTTLMIILLSIDVVLAVLLVIAVRKHLKMVSVILGFVCTVLAAAALALSVVEKPLTFMDQTKESYLAMQKDKNVSSFRVIIDNKIVNRFPEWDDEKPFHYYVDYTNSEVRIITNADDD